MNERIKKLAEQCTEIVTGIDEVEFFDKEKFAELIVQECAEVSKRTGLLNQADYEGEMIADAIKEHFGIQ